MAPERVPAIAAAFLLVALLGLAWLRRPPAPSAPPLTPTSACTPWMADTLPGIGPRSRDDAAAAIRAGALDRLPPVARATARDRFDFTK